MSLTKRPSRAGITAIVIGAISILISCAGTPPGVDRVDDDAAGMASGNGGTPLPVTGPALASPGAVASVEVSLEAERAMMDRFGTTFTENPFIPERTLFRGKLASFYVIRFWSSSDAEFALVSASVASADPKAKFRAYGRDALVEFWAARTAEENRESERRETLIRQYGLETPGITTLRAGRAYYLVITGPADAPADVVITLVVRDERGERTLEFRP
jgi:hypothetical protein